MALIGEDCAISITIGTRAQNGVVTWNGTANIKGIAKKVDLSDKLDKINTKAMGDPRKKFRGTSGESVLKIDHVVAVTGWNYVNSLGATLLGMVAKVLLLENSAFATPRLYVGLIENWHVSLVDAEAQMEDIQIACDIDAVYT